MTRFCNLASLPGFTGSIQPGISVDRDEGVQAGMDIDEGNNNVEEEDEDKDDLEDENIMNIVAAVLSLTLD